MMPKLTTTKVVTERYQIRIPPEVRNPLNIEPGDEVEVTIRPAPNNGE